MTDWSIPRANGYVDNSFGLYKKLSGFRLEENYILASLDMVSLFTNIPIDLAIDGLNNRWTYIERLTRIPQHEFVSAARFILSSTVFSFNNIITFNNKSEI